MNFEEAIYLCMTIRTYAHKEDSKFDVFHDKSKRDNKWGKHPFDS